MHQHLSQNIHDPCVSLGDMNQGQELEVVMAFFVGIKPKLVRGKR